MPHSEFEDLQHRFKSSPQSFASPGPGLVPFDRICAENGIRHLLTAPRSPTTTGKVERFHKTLRAEFLAGRGSASLAGVQAALDGYNCRRPHQGIGMMAAPANSLVPNPGTRRDMSWMLSEWQMQDVPTRRSWRWQSSGLGR